MKCGVEGCNFEGCHSDMGYSQHLRTKHPELSNSERLALRKQKGIPSGFSQPKDNHSLEQALVRDLSIK